MIFIQVVSTPCLLSNNMLQFSTKSTKPSSQALKTIDCHSFYLHCSVNSNLVRKYFFLGTHGLFSKPITSASKMDHSTLKDVSSNQHLFFYILVCLLTFYFIYSFIVFDPMIQKIDPRKEASSCNMLNDLLFKCIY